MQARTRALEFKLNNRLKRNRVRVVQILPRMVTTSVSVKYYRCEKTRRRRTKLPMLTTHRSDHKPQEVGMTAEKPIGLALKTDRLTRWQMSLKHMLYFD